MSAMRLRSLLRRSVVLLVVVLATLVTASAVAQADPAEGIGAIEAKYAAMGGEEGVLGPLETSPGCWLVRGGCSSGFRNGSIWWSPATGAHAFTRRDMWFDYTDENRERGPLGYPVTDTVCGLRDGGCGQHFEGGSLYWSPPMGTSVAIVGRSQDVWAAQGWENGWLGYPTTDRVCTLRDGGCAQHFEGGSLYSSTATPLSFVRAVIRDRWAELGWERYGLGYPVADTFCGLRESGCGQHFLNGSIYWTPARGALTVDIVQQTWAASGWENGPLGYPTSNTFCGLVNEGCGQHFEGGEIYRLPHLPWGSGRIVLPVIRDRWAASNWENGPLGFPMSDTFCGLRGGGCGQHFARGDVYWSPSTGSHAVVTGRIRERWTSRENWENGALGYPTTEAACGLRDGGCTQHFQGGSIYWSPSTPDAVVSGAIRDAWAAQGWENGRLGYPTSDASSVSGVTIQNFQGGQLRLVNGRIN